MPNWYVYTITPTPKAQGAYQKRASRDCKRWLLQDSVFYMWQELYSWNINSSFSNFFFLLTISNQGKWSCSFNTLFWKLFSLIYNSIICWKHLKQLIQVLFFPFIARLTFSLFINSMSSLQSETTQIIFTIVSISHKMLPFLLLSNSKVTYVLPGICDSNAQFTHTSICLR